MAVPRRVLDDRNPQTVEVAQVPGFVASSADALDLLEQVDLEAGVWTGAGEEAGR